MRRACLFALLPALVLASRAVCADTLDSQPGAVQLNLPMSVRQLGMGWVAPGGSDVLRAWSNPAALVDVGKRGEAALVGGALPGGAQQFGVGGAWKLTPDLSVGAAVVRYGLGMDEVDDFGDLTGSAVEHSVMSESLMGSYRWRFLRAGLAIKGIQETIVDSSVSAIGLDVGLAGAVAGATASVAIRNLGGALSDGDADLAIPGEDQPTEIRAGAAYRLASMPLSGGVEFFKAAGRDGRIGVGVEYWAVPFLALRAGGILPGDAAQITAGFSALWRQFSLDYALSAHSTGVNHRLAIAMGFGSAPERRESAAEPVQRAEKPAPEPEPEPVAAPPPPKGAKQLNLAVADLRAENVSSGNAAVIADLLRGEIVKTGTFNVIEKANMDKVLAEQAFQQTGCSSEECAVKLGKLLNVQRMVVGSFGQLLDSYFLNVRVVDVETGRVIFGDAAEGKEVSDLKVGVRNLAKRIATQVR